MLAVVVGAAVGAAAGVAAEPLVRRLPAGIEEANPQAAWTSRLRRPPAMELLGAAVGVLCGLHFGFTGALGPALLLVALLLPVVFIDLEHRVIPNRIVLPGAVAGLAAGALVDPGRLPELALAAVGGCAVVLVLALVNPAGLGLGDVKLTLMLGAYLGWHVFGGIFVGFALAAVPAVGILIRHGRAGGKVGLPLGPFLAAGAIAALFYGSEIRLYLPGG